MTPGEGTRLIAYLRVSTDKQAESGLGIEAQRAAIERAAAAHGWTIVDERIDAGVSGKKASRPGLDAAIRALEDGVADGIVVAKLDRIMRSAKHLLELLERFDEHDWHFVALDQQIDTATPMGRAMLSFAATVNQLERELAAERTREAVAARKARGERVGRRTAPKTEQMRERAVALRAEGLSYRETADVLTREFGKGPDGGTISRSRVYQMLRGTDADG